MEDNLISQETSVESSEESSEETSEETSEESSEETSEETSEDSSEETSEETSEEISEETSEETSEDISEESSEIDYTEPLSVITDNLVLVSNRLDFLSSAFWVLLSIIVAVLFYRIFAWFWKDL